MLELPFMRNFLECSDYKYSGNDVSLTKMPNYWKQQICEEYSLQECLLNDPVDPNGIIHGAQLADIKISETYACPQVLIRHQQCFSVDKQADLLFSIHLFGAGTFEQRRGNN